MSLLGVATVCCAFEIVSGDRTPHFCCDDGNDFLDRSLDERSVVCSFRVRVCREIASVFLDESERVRFQQLVILIHQVVLISQ